MQSKLTATVRFIPSCSAPAPSRPFGELDTALLIALVTMNILPDYPHYQKVDISPLQNQDVEVPTLYFCRF